MEERLLGRKRMLHATVTRSVAGSMCYHRNPSYPFVLSTLSSVLRSSEGSSTLQVIVFCWNDEIYSYSIYLLDFASALWCLNESLFMSLLL